MSGAASRISRRPARTNCSSSAIRSPNHASSSTRDGQRPQHEPVVGAARPPSRPPSSSTRSRSPTSPSPAPGRAGPLSRRRGPLTTLTSIPPGRYRSRGPWCPRPVRACGRWSAPPAPPGGPSARRSPATVGGTPASCRPTRNPGGGGLPQQLVHVRQVRQRGVRPDAVQARAGDPPAATGTMTAAAGMGLAQHPEHLAQVGERLPAGVDRISAAAAHRRRVSGVDLQRPGVHPPSATPGAPPRRASPARSGPAPRSGPGRPRRPPVRVRAVRPAPAGDRRGRPGGPGSRARAGPATPTTSTRHHDGEQGAHLRDDQHPGEHDQDERAHEHPEPARTPGQRRDRVAGDHQAPGSAHQRPRRPRRARAVGRGRPAGPAPASPARSRAPAAAQRRGLAEELGIGRAGPLVGGEDEHRHGQPEVDSRRPPAQRPSKRRPPPLPHPSRVRPRSPAIQAAIGTPDLRLSSGIAVDRAPMPPPGMAGHPGPGPQPRRERSR